MNSLPSSNQRVEGNALHLVALAFLLAVFVAPGRAHPIRTSYAEADYRPASGQLEIAIRLFTDDTEAALAQRAGKKIAVASTPARELDALLFAYVRAQFTVTTTGGAAVPLTWVGRELKDQGQHLWLYVQCALPGGVAGARLRDGLLREMFSDQINSVRVRDHSRDPAAQVTLLFLRDGEQAVTFAR
ncbi:MAG: hypothetical protein HZA93_28715 [Verrucomicrobia bacterium]|nr:hypothetical protein [Verrucomicrobiota bacterium]